MQTRFDPVSIAPAPKEKLNELSSTASVQIFFKECVTVNPNSSVSSAALIAAYEAFCARNGMTPVSRYNLLQYIREKFGIHSQTVRVGATTCSGYRGICLLTDENTVDNVPVLENDDDYDGYNDDDCDSNRAYLNAIEEMKRLN